MLKIAVFVSGRGSNLKSIYDNSLSEKKLFQVSCVISNNAGCEAINFAMSNKIKTFVVKNNPAENEFSYSKLGDKLIEYGIGLIVLAGFLKKIPAEFIHKFENKIINIHPALLPSFGGKGMYGKYVHEAVFNSSSKVSGASVHFVDEIFDNGKIIMQECVDISDVLSPDEIAQKVLKIEHKILPLSIKKFAENKIKIDGTRVVVE
jgi:formyltetrahydrofolate-dependent phosphoribosylglycinamide formyltransferase